MIEALTSLAAFDKVAGTSFAETAPAQKAAFSPAAVSGIAGTAPTAPTDFGDVMAQVAASARDAIRGGEFLAVLPDAKGRQFMFVHYQEPGEVSLDASLYVVYERNERGEALPRLALQEQVDSQGTSDPMYFAQPPAK